MTGENAPPAGENSWRALSGPWRACLELAWEAYRAGSLPIAAVIVDDSGSERAADGGTIVARGRNRIFEPEAPPPYLSCTPLAHAEVNALLALRSERPRATLTLYTTTEPCPLCMGAMRMAGLLRFRYASRDPWAGCAAMTDQVPYLRAKGMRGEGPAAPAFERCLVALQYASFLQRTDPQHPFMLAWRRLHPRATTAGRALRDAGVLERLSDAGAGAEALLEQLSAALQER